MMSLNADGFFMLYNLTHHVSWFDTLVYWIANYGDLFMIGVTAAALVLFFVHDRDWKRRRWVAWGSEVITIGIAVGIPWLITVLLKVLFSAPRPFVTYVQVHPLVVETPYSSFPSGHATVFFALATVIFLYHRKLGYFFLVFAFLIAISRVVAGVHYPDDVIIGAFIGIACAVYIHQNIPKYLSSIFFKKNR